MYFYWLKETFRNIVSIAPLFFFGFILSWQKKKKKKGRITTLLPSIKSIFVREINASLSLSSFLPRFPRAEYPLNPTNCLRYDQVAT